jgi:hypothetical protein
MKKMIERVLVVIMLVVFIWVALSYAEVLCKNLTPNPTYCEWNLFEILIDKAEQIGYN